jgi:hypothetical protein
MRPKGYLASNHGRWSSDGRLTVTLTSDGSSATHRAVAPWPLLRWGGPGTTTSLSQQGLHLKGQREMGTHLGWFSSSDGDRRVARDGGRLAPVFGDGAGLDRRLDQDHGQLPPWCPLASPGDDLAWAVANWWRTATARVWQLLRFVSKIWANGGTIYRGFDTHAYRIRYPK